MMNRSMLNTSNRGLASWRTSSFALGATLLACACSAGSSNERKAAAPTLQARAATLDSAATGQLTRFLTTAVPTKKVSLGMFDSTYTCRDREQYGLMKWIADFKVVAVELMGDTALATTTLTTVANQRHTGETATGDSWSARIQVREDTARWWLVRDSTAGGKWKVCGDAENGFSVLMAGRERDIAWHPAGASAQVARRVVDSVRQARGLPLVR